MSFFVVVHLCTFEDLRVRVIKVLSFCLFAYSNLFVSQMKQLKKRYLIFCSIYSIVSEYVDDTR